ncbi:hypothetical protein HOE04_02155 [archaeon]|jgi:hypothetical protein|nr:hypothetical protein [archaeon]
MKHLHILISLILLINLNLLSATNLDINTIPISNTAISDLNEPAIFDLVITNNQDSDNFEIYSLVGVDIEPDSFTINSQQTKTIRISAMPQKALLSKKGFFTFEYIIKDSEEDIQKKTLTLNVADLESSFDITFANINPNSNTIQVSIKNRISKDFKNLNLEFSSAFFEQKETLTLESLEIKEIEIQLDKEKIKPLEAGSYLTNTKIKYQDKSATKEAMINFLEKEDLYSSESSSGLIKKRQEIIRHNVGNVKKSVSIRIEKNLITALFTNFNIEPTKSGFKGFGRYYIWEKELVSNEELKIISTTNWFYPVFIFLLIFGIIYLSKKSSTNHLTLNKNVSFVKTKGGQFALKVTLRIKAKNHITKIRLIDKLPPLVKLYERFGAIPPNEIDLTNHRLSWEIDSLNKGEERVFSYIIYSKIGVIGRFELPSARAVYERDGKLKDTNSNRAFYINEKRN